MTMWASCLGRRLLSGFAAAPLLTILATAGLAASSGGPTAGMAAQGRRPAQANPAGSAPTAPTTAPAASTAAPPKPKNLEPLQSAKSSGILGKKVTGPDGKELGLIVDVVVAADGHPLAAVIDFGGFLGVGSRKIAIDWRLLKLVPGQPDWQVALRLSRAEVQAAPEYKPDAATDEMVGPPWEAPTSSNGKK